MPPPQVDIVQAIVVLSTLLLSLIIGLYLIRARTRGPILGYVPRNSVPWGPIATALVLFYLVTALSRATSEFTPHDEPAKAAESPAAAARENEPNAKAEPWEMAEGLAVGGVAQLFVVIGFVVVIALLYKATPTDLGLPVNAAQGARDAMIGFVACLAALVPVLVIQALLLFVMRMRQGESGHQLIKMMREGEPSIIVMVAASFMAIVVAPLCEELAFRLLLQGWLEKWEDEQLGWRNVLSSAVIADDEAAPTDSNFVAEDAGPVDGAIAEPPIEPPPSDPPVRGLGGAPYGWVPILISSALFGLAHFGYGPEPVPLFILGLFLGYLYQRTHRIVPCIVCHALFNSFTVFQLWRMVFHGEQ